MLAKTSDINTIIIGAGAAGLSCAACLDRYHTPYILLEKSPGIGNEWMNRYDRLHLHTTKNNSQLPYLKMPDHYPKYVSKNDFRNYLEEYARAFNIQPKFNQQVTSVQQQGDHWIVTTSAHRYEAANVIVATGHARKPIRAIWNGIKNFKGEFIHGAQYKNGKNYKHKRVLVVGFGNSACEIAICLHEHEASPSISVRNGVNILPREILGISVVNIAIFQQWLTKISPYLSDAINKPILRLINGNIQKYGLHSPGYGPLTQIVKHKKIPLLDVGTLALIKQGKVKVYPGIDTVTTDSVRFTDGQEEKFDVIISATGYLPVVNEFIRDFNKVCDEDGVPMVSGRESAMRGLFFCGFNVAPTGMLREITKEAKAIAKHVQKAT